VLLRNHVETARAAVRLCLALLWPRNPIPRGLHNTGACFLCGNLVVSWLTRMGATYWHRRASLDMGNRGVLEGHAMVGSLGLGSSWQRVRLLRLTKKRDQTVEQLDTRCAKRGPSSHRFLQPFQHTVPTFDNLHRWEGRPQRPSFPTIPRIEPCLSWTEPEPSPYPAILRSLSSSTVNHLIASIHGPSQVRTRPRTALRWCLEKITCKRHNNWKRRAKFNFQLHLVDIPYLTFKCSV
jgi:hypothetical protein